MRTMHTFTCAESALSRSHHQILMRSLGATELATMVTHSSNASGFHTSAFVHLREHDSARHTR